jgi:hypothetical protein
LPIGTPISSSSQVSYWNQIANLTDIALVPESQTSLLPSITSGQRAVIFASWADAQQKLPSLLGQISVVVYDPEHWSQTPSSEQNNLVATVQSASSTAHQDGLTFLLVPDQQFDGQYAAQLAPYADIYTLQGQRLETNVSSFDNLVNPEISTIHSASPATQIFVQVSTGTGTPQQADNALQSVGSSINGIDIWTDPAHQSSFQSLVGLIRPIS